jgi:hypothetical protein
MVPVDKLEERVSKLAMMVFLFHLSGKGKKNKNYFRINLSWGIYLIQEI